MDSRTRKLIDEVSAHQMSLQLSKFEQDMRHQFSKLIGKTEWPICTSSSILTDKIEIGKTTMIRILTPRVVFDVDSTVHKDFALEDIPDCSVHRMDGSKCVQSNIEGLDACRLLVHRLAATVKDLAKVNKIIGSSPIHLFVKKEAYQFEMFQYVELVVDLAG